MANFIEDHVRSEAERTLAAYAAQPNLVREHVGIEDEVLSGGYGHRQIHELIQNAADAILEDGRPGRVHLLLTGAALYCANEGAPIDAEGIDAILNSHMSRKRGSQIGQFGIGFKSVLAISRSPEFHSRSGSFAFDADWSRQRIQEVLPGVDRTPILRLAKVLTPDEQERDPLLVALLQWATTVVKLPRTVSHTEWISDDLRLFPREFLLFSPHVRLLTLEDRATARRREIATKGTGNTVAISEGGQDSEWTVFENSVALEKLGSEARSDADRKTQARSDLPILWAIPREGKRVRGQFWAFFPTETETTLTGIVNAPWKTNADRQNLLDGPFNRALLKKTVELVVASLESLHRSDDPGYVLDLLPARAADAAGWADTRLIDELEKALVTVRCVADANGALQAPGSVRMRPDLALVAARDDLPAMEGEVANVWVHVSVEKRERRAKAERIGVRKTEIREWLEAIGAPATPDSSVRAILATAFLETELPKSQEDALRESSIILTEAGTLVAAKTRGLLIPLVHGSVGVSALRVHHLVAADPRVRDALRTLGVEEESPSSQLDLLLSSFPVPWDRVWPLLRELSTEDAEQILHKHATRVSLHVRTRAGNYARLSQTLLVGPIVPLAVDRDAAVAIDPEYHRDDDALLRKVGATETPVPGRDERKSEWMREYMRAAHSAFYATLPPGASRPQPQYLSFTNFLTVGPLDPLMRLSDEGRLEMTHALLLHVSNERPWVLKHNTRASSYPSLDFTPPLISMMQRYGRLATSLGIRSLDQAVGPGLAQWSTILPVVTLDAATADVLKLPNSLSSLNDSQWVCGFSEIEHVEDAKLAGQFYSAAAGLVPPPSMMWCWKGETKISLSPTAIHLASDAETDQAHRLTGVPSILVPDRDSLELLISRWGMQGSAGTVRYVAASDETPLVDTFPGIRRYLPESAWEQHVQPCESIWFESTGEKSTGAISLNFARVGDRLCFVTSLEPAALLRHIAQDLGVPLTNAEVQDTLDYARRVERQRLVETVRKVSHLSEKLALLIDSSTLLADLPSGVQSILAENGTQTSAGEIAQTALAVFGVEVLSHYAGALDRRGLEPPSRWAGSPRAQEFVDELGFPPEYAGFQHRRRDPAMDVDGPVVLKDLHDFQQIIGKRIQEFLRKTTPDRGLLSLPTGSGKTRVVVQAVIESMKLREFDGCVVWIAQSDELCEQAVQSWAQVWRALGPRRRLRISRLWGQTNNRIVEAEGAHIVVATYQSLVSRLRSPLYRWLRDASCVIIDEAHGSIAPSYTDILDSFGFTAQTTPRPLIGLTATPFRSAEDPAETQWLVNRYGAQRFDHHVLTGDDPYPLLQDMGVLARVDQQVLEGSTLTLTEAELAELEQFRRLPASAESRLGESPVRNDRLVESISGLQEDWPVLLFATSVDHAHLMAALLSMKGVSAKAISGETDPGARRHYIEQFRQGRIRVLSNYNVLSTGFDAPALRALYIARPVYSPVLYQQMIGRGLRGPLNGGKERCLVVNVEDNIAQFGHQLAFRHFEYLWRSET